MDMGVILGIMTTIMGTGNIFLYCFVGTLTTDIFARYADFSYESVWYKIPVELQKYLLLVVVDAQNPHAFDGFGFIQLDLVFFMKVT